MATILSGRQIWPLVAILLVYSGNSAGAAGDPPEFTYRSSVAEVRLSFSAIDQNNHGVATLEAGDFAVVDKGVIVRSFQSFTHSDAKKVEIAVLADASGSVRPRFRQEISSILELVAQTAGVPEENISIFSFQGMQPAMLCAGDCRASHAAERLPETRAGGLTPLFDTVVFASEYLARHGDAKTEKILIVFSDGADTISRNSFANAVDAALMDDVRVFSIDLNSSSSQGSGVLYRLADATGGRYFSARDGVSRALNVILEGFRATYTVSYRLPNHAPGFHTVQVLPTRDLRLQLRSRSGYYYPNHAR